MGIIRPELRFAIKDFLNTLSSWQPEQVEPDHVVEDRRQWAHTILGLLGDDYPDDLEMMALASLARAAIAICDNPQDADVIERFRQAGERFMEISAAGR